MAGIRDSISSSSSPKVNFTNLILRILQLIFGVTAVAFYSIMYNSKLNKDSLTNYSTWLNGKLILSVVAGSISTITAVAFALIPALISYYYVAIAFIWDWIIFFIWCAVFGWFHATFRGYNTYPGPDRGDVVKLANFQWVDLANLLLWLATALMSVACLLHDRRSLRFGRSGV